MRLLDAVALTPVALRGNPAWLAVLRARFSPEDPSAIEVIDTHSARYQWLQRLSGADVWGDVQVVTTIAGFLYWRLANERVEVIDSGGKKMAKGYRTTSEEEWAAGIVAGDHRKAAVNKVLKLKGGPPRKFDELLVDYRSTPAGHISTAPLIETDGVYDVVTEETFPEVRRQILERASNGGLVTWDSETDQAGEEDSAAPNPYTARLVGLSLSVRSHHAFYLPLAHDVAALGGTGTNITPDRGIGLVRDLHRAARDGAGRVGLHNAKYDYSVMANPVQRVPADEVYSWLGVTDDTMLMASTLNLPGKLKKLAPALLGVKAIDFKRLTRGLPFSQVPLEPASVYAGQDADWAFRLHPVLSAIKTEWDSKPDVDATGVYEQEVALIEYFMRMERHGLPFSRKKLATHWLREAELLDYTKARFFEACRRAFIPLPDDFNIGSTDQMQWLLYKQMRLPVLKRTKTGAPATGEPALNELMARGYMRPWAAIFRWLLAYKEHVKRLSSFIRPISGMLQADHRTRSSFHSVGADTGRTSASDWNCQQAYKDLKKCIEAEGGEFGSLDYSQVELRVLAAVHNEPKMLNVYQQPSHLPDGSENPAADPHLLTQQLIGLPTRTKAKNFNFGVAFGAMAPTLSRTAAIELAACEKFYRDFWVAYPDYAASLKAMQQRDMARGYTTTWRGRFRLLSTPERPHDALTQLRLVANTPIQGGALDIAKACMYALLPLLREAEHHGIHPANFVHDEFLFESSWYSGKAWPEFLALVKQTMIETNPFIDRVPLATDLEVGRVWGSVAAPPTNKGELVSERINMVDPLPVFTLG